MKKCKHSRKKSYGSKRKLVWCDICDADLVVPRPSKKRARQQGKQELCNILIDNQTRLAVNNIWNTKKKKTE